MANDSETRGSVTVDESAPKVEKPGFVVSKLADRVENLLAAVMVVDEGQRLGKLFTEAKDHERHDDLSHAIQYLVEIRRATDALEALTKYVRRVEKPWEERVIPDKMDLAKTTTLTVDGYRVSGTNKPVWSVRADQKDAAYDYLRAFVIGKDDDGNDVTLSSLLIETVNSSTLSATGKELIKDRALDLPEDLFNFAVIPGISVTRVGHKKAPSTARKGK